MKNISILGSTGSIGEQTIDVVRERQDLRVVAVSGADHRIDKLEAQIREFRPKKAAVWSESGAKELKQRVADLDVEILQGMDGMIEISSMPEADVLVTAISGMIAYAAANNCF